MSEEFRYNEPAEAFEENLEEVLDSHKQEVAEKQAAEAAALPTEPPALERIARGSTLDEMDQLVSAKKKTASAVLAEHRVRTMLQDGRESRVAVVDDFLTQAKAQ